MEIQIRISPQLVTVSVLVAVFASYVALSLVNNFAESKGKIRALWLSSGAFTMGIGIWSMHFIGMLAYEMPGMSMGYNLPLMLLSILVAIGASGLAFLIISRGVVPKISIIAGGIAMAAAIAGMHYIGMDSMRMDAIILWNIPLVVLSIGIALIASYGALLILIRFRDYTERFTTTLIASTVMGLAVSGMHYTGMLAATFLHHETNITDQDQIIVTDWFVPIVIAGPVFLIAMAMVSSATHRILTRRSRKANELLGKSEEKFRRLVEAVKDYAIFMLDEKGLVTTWNHGAERITGYREQEILGRSSSLLYSDADIEARLPEKDLRFAREIAHYEAEGERKRKDGSTFWASVTTVPLYNENGTISEYSTVIRDITQVKESARKMRQINEELEERVRSRTLVLEQRESQLKAITNAVPVLISQIDRDEKVLFANDAFRNWFQSTSLNLNGQSLRELLGDERYEANRTYFQKALAGELTSYERLSQTPWGIATLAVTFVPEFDSRGAVRGFIIVASDISKYKAIQLELEKARQTAEGANAIKTAFLANMSHEIRTPLGAVIGFSDLLITDDLPSSDRIHYIEVIKRNGQLLSNIINDILDLSKVEAGKLEIALTEVPFSEILNELRSILGLEAAAKGIELILNPDAKIPLRICTDPLRLRQILLNIVGNAIKFTQRGSVTVDIKFDENTSKIAFIVTDTGEGISPEQQARLFQPFMQADVSTTRKFGGTGLGLALSKKLANMLHGDVKLTASALGEGSTFEVTITVPTASKTEPLGSNSLNRAGARVRSEIELDPLKVLVVDDSLDNLALIQRILRLARADVVTASNGQEAVEKALDEDFSLILMDIQMPVMDGYEATHKLRQAGFRKPIIALTAHAMSEEKKRSLESEFDDHITKPIDRNQLLKNLSKYRNL